MLDKARVHVGIAPIGWTNDDMPELGGDIPFEQCVREMAQAGYAGSEVGNKYPRDPATLKMALASYNLVIASAWYSSYFTTQAGFGPSLTGFRKHAAFLQAMGARVVNIAECGGAIHGQMHTPILECKAELDEAGWDTLIAGLNEAGDMAREHNMRLAYHPHMGTVVQSGADVERLMSRVDPDLVWLLADTGHVYYAGGDPVAFVREYRERIVHVHLKDIRAPVLQRVRNERLSFLQSVKAGVFTVPGDGVIDFKAIFAELDQAGYEGWLIVEAEQDPQRANPLTYARKARGYIGALTGL